MKVRTGLLLAVLLAIACAGPTPATLPAGMSSGNFAEDIVLVIENRTQTPVQLSAGVVGACAEGTYTQPAIDAAVAALLDGSAPRPPLGTVDLTSIGVAPPAGAAPPAVILVTEQGTMIQFGPFDRSRLPACVGRARPPS